MTSPLLMLGPGGDFQTRFAGRGTGILKDPATHPASRQTHAHDGDTDTAGSFAGYARLPRRRLTDVADENPAKTSGGFGGASGGGDSFERAAPAAGPGTYDAAGHRTGAPTRAELRAAAAAWVQTQSFALSDLAHDHAAHRRLILSATGTTPGTNTADDSAHPQTPPLTVHITPPAADTRRLPAFLQQLITQIHRSTTHGLEPHPQATQNPQPHPRDSPHPRLFADDAGTRRRNWRLQSHHLRARRSAHQKGRTDPRQKQSPLFGNLA